MRSPRDSNHAILRKLYQWWCGEHPRRSDEQADQQIKQVVVARDRAAVPTLIMLLHSGDGSEAKAAAEAIEQIIADCAPLELARLDTTVRETAEWRSSPIKPKDVRPFSYGLVGVLGVSSFDASGFVREAAVRELAEETDGRELAFLLIRVNDWVGPVRDAAKDAVAQRVRADYAPHFVRCLPLVYRLIDQSRENHQILFGAILGLLQSTEGRQAVRQGIGSSDRTTRRLAFRVMADAPVEERLPLLQEASSAEDTVIKLWAARELRQRLDGEPLRAALERFWKDRFMPVRREALYGFSERLPEVAPSLLRTALLDPHVSIREAARFYLRELGEQDFARIYRDRLNHVDGDELATAVAGIGETGIANDAPRLIALLTHPNARVRRAAVRAMGRLDPDGCREQVATALQDRSPSVAKTARDVILARPHLLSAADVWSTFQETAQPHVRRIALTLMAHLTWWDSASLLLLALGSADHEAREQAIELLRRWQWNPHRLYVRPTPGQIQMIEDALRRHASVLPRPVRDDLESLLSYAKREAN